MRPSHAGRQIRDPRLLASVSNWSPQLTRSAAPAGRLLVPRGPKQPQRHQSWQGFLSTCPHALPSSTQEKTNFCHRVPPSAGKFQIPRGCWADSGCLEPCLSQEPNRTQDGDTLESGRPVLCFCCKMLGHTLYHVREAVVHRRASRPYLRNPRSQLLINPAHPRVQTNKPQPCCLMPHRQVPGSARAPIPV